MDRATQWELESIKTGLQNIIDELQSISCGVNRDFEGIGNGYCATSIQNAASHYVNVKRKLNQIDTSEVTEEFRAKQEAEKAVAAKAAEERAAGEASSKSKSSNASKPATTSSAKSSNTKAALNQRTWKLVDDGGINWGGGIDENAKYKDQYGKVYTGEQLYDALVKDGMSKSKAKDYVVKLQKRLGA